MAEVVLWNHYPKTNDLLFFCNLAAYRVLACESIRFSFALRRWGRFVLSLSRRRSSSRNVPSGVERRRNGCFRRLTECIGVFECRSPRNT